MSGGYDVPRDKIISRYSKALALIPQLIEACDKGRAGRIKQRVVERLIEIYITT